MTSVQVCRCDGYKPRTTFGAFSFHIYRSVYNASMATYQVHSLEQLASLAQAFVTTVAALPSATHATVVTLSGDLGAGKTSFTQALAAALGVSEQVTSPTFVIEKIYHIISAPFTGLIHIDAYRLGSFQELVSLGWAELIATPHRLVVIEWPERVVECIPDTAIAVSCRGLNHTTHEYTFPFELVQYTPHANESY